MNGKFLFLLLKELWINKKRRLEKNTVPIRRILMDFTPYAFDTSKKKSSKQQSILLAQLWLPHLSRKNEQRMNTNPFWLKPTYLTVMNIIQTFYFFSQLFIFTWLSKSFGWTLLFVNTIFTITSSVYFWCVNQPHLFVLI